MALHPRRTLESLGQFVGDEAVARLQTDPVIAEGLPGSVYVSEDVYDLERQSVFRKGWFAVAFGSELPEAGDVLPVQVAGWELLLVRRGDGSIGAFHNICRHRGMRLVGEAANVTTLRCGWHCWTYALDGDLIATPLIGGRGVDGQVGNDVAGLDRSGLGLMGVECDVWHDLVFVRLDPGGPSLAQHLAPLTDYFADHDLGSLALGAAGPELELPANWKLVVEGGIEGYHLPWVHPQMQQPAGYDVELGGDCFVGIASTLGPLGVPADGGPTLPLFVHLRQAAQRGKVQRFAILFVVPTAIVSVYPNHAVFTLLRPIDVQRAGVRRRFYFVGDAATDPALAVRRSGTLDAWYQVSAQDFDYVAGVQATCRPRSDLGMATRFAPHWERGVLEFQRWALRATTS